MFSPKTANQTEPEIIEPELIGTENSARVVWELAWPAVALNSLQIVNTLLDRGFIGRLAPSALTAHGGATSILFLMFQLAVSLATGSTALVSRAYGADNRSEVRQAAQQSLRLAIIGGISIGLLTALIAPLTAHALVPASDHAAIHAMQDFLLAYAVGLPGIFVIQVLAGSLRGIGDTRSPMVISGIQILMHMTLNFMLVLPHGHWPGLGLTGAGIALSASALVSAGIYIAYAGSTPLGHLWSLKLPDWAWAQRVLRITIPAATMACLRVFSLTAFTIVLTAIPDGSAAIAAMTTGFAIESIIIMPAFGLAAAAAALVGQSLGMKRPDRASRLGWTAAHHGAIVTVTISAVIFFAAPGIAALLLNNQESIMRPAITLIRMLCLTEIGFCYAMVLIGAMQGAGDTKEPMRISILSLWGLRVPMAIILALPTGKVLLSIGAVGIALPYGVGLGANGAWIALASTQGLQGILAAILFNRGRWKNTVV
jgi:putative MATE family efflux protein